MERAQGWDGASVIDELRNNIACYGVAKSSGSAAGG